MCVQVFDVNETLLDLAAMDPHFERVFGDAAPPDDTAGGDAHERFMAEVCQRCGLTYAEHLAQEPPHVFTTIPDDRARD